jgi:hypothetical protein
MGDRCGQSNKRTLERKKIFPNQKDRVSKKEEGKPLSTT